MSRSAERLAAVAHALDAGEDIAPDDDDVRDFLAVRAVLRGEAELPGALADELRHERVSD